jgi:hypothetical protein
MTYALLAPGYRQQFPVEFHVPIPAESQFPKSSIERGAMTVSLGVGKRSIHIEQDCPQWPILLFCICFQNIPICSVRGSVKRTIYPLVAILPEC